MRRLLTILLTLVAAQAIQGQDTASSALLRQDTSEQTLLLTPVPVVPSSSLCENITLTATSTGLISLGLLAAYQPDVNNWAVALRDEVTFYNPPKLEFDNYLQYLPTITPVVLNLCGVEGRHNLKKLLLLESSSYLLGSGWLNTFKLGFAKERPDHSAKNSFPSGHTFTAFVGAEIIRREYGEEHPWLAVVAYGVATLVGVMRVYNNRHWAGDVLAGAGLGILSTTLVYWVLD